MPIKLEVGKYYEDRNGQVMGPMIYSNESEEYPFTDGVYTFTASGKYTTLGGESGHDLINEVHFQSPIEVNAPKPPIGLIPQNIFLDLQNKQRVQDILDACSRYNEANMNIPQEWIDELSYRRGEINIEVEPKTENVVPDYMKDFEHNGSTYSVVEDTTRDGCDECHFWRAGCGDANTSFADITGFRCHSAPTRIHFVKKQ